MPKEQKPDRTTEQTSALAVEVMKRLLQTPPTPHENVAKKRAPKKKTPRKT
jgi:hypothetical protein